MEDARSSWIDIGAYSAALHAWWPWKGGRRHVIALSDQLIDRPLPAIWRVGPCMRLILQLLVFIVVIRPVGHAKMRHKIDAWRRSFEAKVGAATGDIRGKGCYDWCKHC